MRYLALVLVAACNVLGPADRAAIAEDAATIEKCQEEGRACRADGGPTCTKGTPCALHCLDVYDACMKKAGLE